MSERVDNWVAFWDQPHSIYVNAHHLDVHYRDIAEAIVALLPRDGAHVLDHGCGEALHAGLVAERAGQLFLCESASSVRAKLQERLGSNPRIAVISPEQAGAIPPGSLDLVVASSLAQYLTPAELDALLALWRTLLKPDGVLILGDVVPPDASLVTDVSSLLLYAARHRFLLSALAGLARTLVSPYRKLRQKIGITSYSQEEITAKLRASGFSVERLPYNLEHNPGRMTFRARPDGGSS